jgi:hypothetical protein
MENRIRNLLRKRRQARMISSWREVKMKNLKIKKGTRKRRKRMKKRERR